MHSRARIGWWSRLPGVVGLSTVLGACASSRPALPSAVIGTGRATSARVERCDAFVQSLSRRDGLPPASSALLAQTLTLHGGTVVRWPVRRPRLRVWLQPPPAEGDALAAARASAARHGVLDWNGATRAVQLVVSADSAVADVVVVWASGIPTGVGASTAAPAGRSGIVRSVATGEIEHVVVVLAVYTASGALATPRDLHAMAIHEVGHGLGLAHSPPSVARRGSVMASSVPTDDVTASDRRALRAWYALPAGTICDPASDT